MGQTETSSPLLKWPMEHPRLAAWIVLSLGMVILLVIEARDVGLTLGNWIALIVATVLVAGACIWIVSWEDVDENGDTTAKPANAVSAPVAEASAPASTMAESATPAPPQAEAQTASDVPPAETDERGNEAIPRA